MHKLVLLVLLCCFHKANAYTNSIVAIVNDVPITSNEYNERIKLEQFLSQQSSSPQKIPTDKQILKTLLIEHIVQANTKEIGIIISTEMVDNSIKSIEQNNNIEIGHFRKIFNDRNISYTSYHNMIRSQIIMQQIEGILLKQNITITNLDIDNKIIDYNLSENPKVSYLVFETDNNDTSYKALLKLKNKMPTCNHTIDFGKNITRKSLSGLLSKLPLLEKSILSSTDINIPTMIVKSGDKYKFFILCSREIGAVSDEIKNNIANNIAQEKVMVERQKLIEGWYDNAVIQILHQDNSE